MKDKNLLDGEVKVGSVLRDSWYFYKLNFRELIGISFPYGLTLLLYGLLMMGFMWLANSFAGNPIMVLMSILIMPLSIAGAYILNIAFVTIVKRINALLSDTKMCLKDSLKGTPLASLKVYGISVLGALISQAPMVFIIPLVFISILFSGVYAGNVPIGAMFIVAISIIAVIFVLALILWFLTVGVHTITIGLTIIIDTNVTKWMSWARGLLRGRMKNALLLLMTLACIAGAVTAPVWIFPVLHALNDGNIYTANMFIYPMLALVYIFMYSFLTTAFVIFYYRLKSEKTELWEKVCHNPVKKAPQASKTEGQALLE